jgi:hypothetical protein
MVVIPFYPGFSVSLLRSILFSILLLLLAFPNQKELPCCPIPFLFAKHVAIFEKRIPNKEILPRLHNENGEEYYGITELSVAEMFDNSKML